MRFKPTIILFTLSLFFITGCGPGQKVGTSSPMGMTLMKPSLSEETPDGVDVRYIEVSFGTGAPPQSVLDAAAKHCKKYNKDAYHVSTGRGLIFGHTTKAYFKCRNKK
jgi:hypothetical protein